jgi:chloramphenicol-sensitive protein RarD
MAFELADKNLMGTGAAVSAFGIWALFPIYFNQFGPHVSALEILLQRVVWAWFFLLAFVLLSGRWGRVAGLFRRPKTLLALTGSALCISLNWGIFIWAVTHGEILQSSLGYYINPLFNVLLGYCFLGERPQPLQRLAIAVAAAGVLLSVIGYGQVPWLALVLAVSFGLYGLIRKQVETDSVTGLMVETLLLLPLAAGWLSRMYLHGEAVFMRADARTDLMLVGAGLITLVPLMLFAVAARRLPLTTLGFAQYIAPTGHFLIGVLLYAEPFTAADAVTFVCIWAGLALYSADLWRTHRRQHGLK